MDTFETVAGEIVIVVGASTPVLLSAAPPPAPQPVSSNVIKTNRLVMILLGRMLNRLLLEDTAYLTSKWLVDIIMAFIDNFYT